MNNIRTVGIPAIHFAKQTTKFYVKPKVATFRESLQNSVDSGAKNIRIETGDNWFSIDDDGCGMSEEVLVPALLTLSGSQKEEGNVGGFGAAKELILFAQESYEIETNNLVVSGECLEYLLDYGEHRQGTKITIKWHELFNYNQDAFVEEAILYLSKCEYNCNISLNGITVPQLQKGDLSKSLDWADIYVQDVEEEVNHIQIRINGLQMFSRYIESIKKQIVVEITKPSIQVLSTSRDSMNYSAGQDLDKLINEILIDKSSFGALYGKKVTYRGKRNLYSLKSVEEAENNLKDIIEEVNVAASDAVGVSEQVQAIRAIKTRLEETPQRSQTVDRQIEFIEKVERELESELENDFTIHIRKKGIESIPDELSPKGGLIKKKYKQVAKMWKATIIQVLENARIYIGRWNIGFVLSDEIIASFEKGDGIRTILINPYNKRWEKLGSDPKAVNNMIVTACHELAHYSYQYHDEYFTSEFEKIMVKAMSNISISSIRNLAKEIQL